MLKRKVLDKLIAWQQKAGGREALLIEGARRVGKSTIAKEFGRTQYKSYILVDFARLPRDVRDIFENQRDDFDTFFMLLSAYYRTRLYKRESLIIFDEVQRYPAARELIKYLVADGRLSQNLSTRNSSPAIRTHPTAWCVPRCEAELGRPIWDTSLTTDRPRPVEKDIVSTVLRCASFHLRR